MISFMKDLGRSKNRPTRSRRTTPAGGNLDTLLRHIPECEVVPWLRRSRDNGKYPNANRRFRHRIGFSVAIGHLPDSGYGAGRR